MKVITIGRSKEHNDIVVNDEKVSRNHLQMVKDDNGNYKVLDLGSTNGTYVNGQRILGEVPLKETDELRIGDTVLSWQLYFGAQPIPAHGAPMQSSAPVKSETPRRKPKIWLIFVIIGVAFFLLLAAGGVGWKIYHDKKQKENLEQQLQDAKDAQEKQVALDAAKDNARKANEEYEKAMRRAAETQSKEDLAYAEEMQKKKLEADKDVLKKEQELKKLQAELAVEKEKASEAVQQAQDANDKRKAAETNATNAENAKKEAQKKQQSAELEAQLTRQFYSQLRKINDKSAIQVCKDLGLGEPKAAEAKDAIEGKFLESDNNTKQSINNRLASAAASQQKGNEAKSENEEPQTGDTSSEN